MRITSRSPEETQSIGRELGKLAQPSDVILLVGNLGAGKTCLTQGIAWGLDVSGYARSPSFVLMNEYKGRLPMYHIDLYRLDNIAEIANTLSEIPPGFVEAAKQGIAHAVRGR